MKKKVIFIIFLICAITLGMLILLLSKLNKDTAYDKSNTIVNKTKPFVEIAQEEYSRGKIVPQNFTPLIREYAGEVKSEKWYKHIYLFVHNYIPKIQKNEDLSSYYNENSLNIRKDLGIDSYEKFKLLADEVKNISYDAKFVDSEFDITEIDSTEKLLSVKLNIFFEDNEQLNVRFTIYNEIKDDISISILPE